MYTKLIIRLSLVNGAKLMFEKFKSLSKMEKILNIRRAWTFVWKKVFFFPRSVYLLTKRKKREECATTISWIRTKVSFAISRSALLCLKGSRATRRLYMNLHDTDFEVERGLAEINYMFPFSLYYINVILQDTDFKVETGGLAEIHSMTVFLLLCQYCLIYELTRLGIWKKEWIWLARCFFIYIIIFLNIFLLSLFCIYYSLFWPLME